MNPPNPPATPSDQFVSQWPELENYILLDYSIGQYKTEGKVMKNQANPPEVSFDTVLDGIIQQTTCASHMLEVNDCVGCNPKTAICSVVQVLVTASKPEKFIPKHSESDEEGSGKAWYNQALDEYEARLLERIKNAS